MKRLAAVCLLALLVIGPTACKKQKASPTVPDSPAPPPTTNMTATPTDTLVATATSTTTATDSPTATVSPSPTTTLTWTASPTSSPADTGTFTASATVSNTATSTWSPSTTPTWTVSPTATPTFSPTATDTSTPTPSVFRLSDLDLRDPHAFVNFLGCRDVTDTALAGFAVNSTIQTSIQTDGNSDGYLDSSYLLVFRPLDQSGSGILEIHTGAGCTTPLAGTSCGSTYALVTTTTYQTSPTGTCLDALAGTTRPYSPAIATPAGPCFSSGTFTLTLDMGGIPLTLRDVTVAGTFVGNPATQITNGLMRGFVSETDANTTILPASLPLIGGQTLSTLLPGGMGNCSATDDRDMDSTVRGWWFYFNFPAARVTYTGP